MRYNVNDPATRRYVDSILKHYDRLLSRRPAFHVAHVCAFYAAQLIKEL